MSDHPGWYTCTDSTCPDADLHHIGHQHPVGHDPHQRLGADVRTVTPTYELGWWQMPCFNSLSPDQQTRLVEHGNLPIDYKLHLTGDCHNGAEVEVTTIWDEYPGPRFYCTHCARDYIVDREQARRRAAYAERRNVGIIGHTDVGKTTLSERIQHAAGPRPRPEHR